MISLPLEGKVGFSTFKRRKGRMRWKHFRFMSNIDGTERLPPHPSRSVARHLPLKGKAFLYHIIVRGLGLGEVGDGDAVKILVGHVVKILPHLQGAAFRGTGARIRVGG